jgi:hypothetical protein
MVRVQVVVKEHGREYVHTVAEGPSLDAVRDVLQKLRERFGDNRRIKIVRDSEG